jgi:8-amino-7-oxononanoate synthase
VKIVETSEIIVAEPYKEVGSMSEFEEIRDQMMGKAYHRIMRVSSLPNPVFQCEGREIVSFSTNNYLGLATSKRLTKCARLGLEKYGVGNCESRLLGGDMDIYRNLEDKLARLKQKETAVLFATGFLTNLGVLSALTNLPKFARIYGYKPRKHYKYVYFTDESNHISIREGIRMSRVDKSTYRHLDMNNLEDKLKASTAEMKIIVSDGVFSMDGDIVPLPDMLGLAERYDAFVYIDDAHATGVLGSTGGGTTQHFAVCSPRLICMGTLSKAYGAIGGFVATNKYLGDMIRLTCTAYGFTSTLPPDQVCAVSEAMDIVLDEPQRLQRLWENQRYFVVEMDKLGYTLVSRSTCIVPVLIGNEPLCEWFSDRLEERGFHVDSILFPGVPKGQARLRFVMNANHTRKQIDELLGALGELRDMSASGGSADKSLPVTAAIPGTLM